MTTTVKTSPYVVKSTDRRINLQTDESHIAVYIGPGTSPLTLNKTLANYYTIVLIGDGCKINGKDIIVACREAKTASIELKPDGDNWTYKV